MIFDRRTRRWHKKMLNPIQHKKHCARKSAFSVGASHKWAPSLALFSHNTALCSVGLGAVVFFGTASLRLQKIKQLLGIFCAKSSHGLAFYSGGGFKREKRRPYGLKSGFAGRVPACKLPGPEFVFSAPAAEAAPDVFAAAAPNARRKKHLRPHLLGVFTFQTVGHPLGVLLRRASGGSADSLGCWHPKPHTLDFNDKAWLGSVAFLVPQLLHYHDTIKCSTWNNVYLAYLVPQWCNMMKYSYLY